MYLVFTLIFDLKYSLIIPNNGGSGCNQDIDSDLQHQNLMLKVQTFSKLSIPHPYHTNSSLNICAQPTELQT